MTRLLLQTVLLVLVTGYSWNRGGWQERAAATVYCVALAADQAAHRLFGVSLGPTTYAYVDPWHFVLDGALLVAVVAIGTRPDRTWTIWLGSVQILAVIGHVARALEAQMPLMVYAILNRYPFWLAILIIAWGTHNHARRNPRTSPG